MQPSSEFIRISRIGDRAPNAWHNFRVSSSKKVLRTAESPNSCSSDFGHSKTPLGISTEESCVKFQRLKNSVGVRVVPKSWGRPSLTQRGNSNSSPSLWFGVAYTFRGIGYAVPLMISRIENPSIVGTKDGMMVELEGCPSVFPAAVGTGNDRPGSRHCDWPWRPAHPGNARHPGPPSAIRLRIGREMCHGTRTRRIMVPPRREWTKARTALKLGHDQIEILVRVDLPTM